MLLEWETSVCDDYSWLQVVPSFRRFLHSWQLNTHYRTAFMHKTDTFSCFYDGGHQSVSVFEDLKQIHAWNVGRSSNVTGRRADRCPSISFNSQMITGRHDLTDGCALTWCVGSALSQPRMKYSQYHIRHGDVTASAVWSYMLHRLKDQDRTEVSSRVCQGGIFMLNLNRNWKNSIRDGAGVTSGLATESPRSVEECLQSVVLTFNTIRLKGKLRHFEGYTYLLFLAFSVEVKWEDRCLSHIYKYIELEPAAG